MYKLKLINTCSTVIGQNLFSERIGKSVFFLITENYFPLIKQSVSGGSTHFSTVKTTKADLIRLLNSVIIMSEKHQAPMGLTLVTFY